MALKLVFFLKNHKNRPAAGGFAPDPRLWHIWVVPLCSACCPIETFFKQKNSSFWVQALIIAKSWLCAWLQWIIASFDALVWGRSPRSSSKKIRSALLQHSADATTFNKSLWPQGFKTIEKKTSNPSNEIEEVGIWKQSYRLDKGTLVLGTFS